MTNIAKDSATLSWLGDNGDVSLNDIVIAENVSSPYIVNNLSSNTEYAVKVKNRGGESDEVTFKTKEITYEEVTVTCDFKNKTTGSVVENPHSAFYIWQSASVQLPSAAWIELGSTGSSNYSRISDLDEVVQSIATAATASAHIAQFKFKYNVIEAIERYDSDYFSSRGATTIEEKIIVARTEIITIINNVWGYGSAPSSTYMAVRYWSISASWTGSAVVSGTTVKQATETIDAANIDDQGFISVIAYTAASDATKASAVSIDYPSLDITFLVEED
ncbi:hypothetical protein I6N96_08900 [Enterococcus sp. BWM-S5]|uniref:Fibronectin type-III domain-containing protein n=1 Tax=Enterococcus larvae TaxID=2794352 RepID=A0ABS4CKD9_9ENTE|nr:hypothetical protein [Enterococcus larvae]MBP1046402.1 hypothetical protein [Enterococcus larvae]